MQGAGKDARRRLRVLVATGLFALLLAVLAWWRQAPSASVVWSEQDRAQVMLPKGREAPDFALPGRQGAEVSLASLRGGSAALAFITAGCPYCQKLLARLDSVAVPAPRQVVAICRGTRAEADSLARAHTFPYRILADCTGATHKAYRVSGVPTVYLVDARGRISGARSGWPGAWELMAQ
ncbi:MAG: redoxin domain-containing protein [Candidatus Latescibacterota bacterium]